MNATVYVPAHANVALRPVSLLTLSEHITISLNPLLSELVSTVFEVRPSVIQCRLISYCTGSYIHSVVKLTQPFNSDGEKLG